jgi:hypothetical protein
MTHSDGGEERHEMSVRSVALVKHFLLRSRRNERECYAPHGGDDRRFANVGTIGSPVRTNSDWRGVARERNLPNGTVSDVVLACKQGSDA